MSKTIKPSQTTNQLLMVRPSNFGFNPQTAASNRFQQNDGNNDAERIKQLAVQEFDALVAILRSKDIGVTVVQDTPVPIKTDAVFPNNWISFHANGTIVTYPMLSKNRRLEQQNPVIEAIESKFEIKKQVDYSHYAAKGQFLEGTGSLVLDRVHRIAYACLSPRTDGQLLDAFCSWADYQKVVFGAYDRMGVAIYHTNVMMAMGTNFVIVCLAAITNQQDKTKLLNYFSSTQKTIIDITFEQMSAYAGNMLEVQNKAGVSFLVMSSQAYQSLHPRQIEQIEQHSTILHSSIETIERYGGGSARCMIAEVFLPILGI